MTDVLTSLQSDFKLFLQALWDQLDLPLLLGHNTPLQTIYNTDQTFTDPSLPRSRKSWITGAFVLWTLFNDAEKKIMIISASKERADNMSIFLQKLIIETPWLSHSQPKSDDARWSRISSTYYVHHIRHHQSKVLVLLVS